MSVRFIWVAVALLAAVVFPPWRYHLAITEVDVHDIRVRGADVSTLAPIWRPPFVVPADSTGMRMVMSGRRIDWARAAVWCMVLVVVLAGLRRQRAFVVMMVAVLAIVCADRVFVLLVRPQAGQILMERKASVLLSLAR